MVLWDGRVVVDQAFGCDSRALFWIFSASEPFIALLVHLLAERGELALDDRVAAYWPRFAHGGKEAVTMRQILQHRSGMAVARGSRLSDRPAHPGHEGARHLEAVSDAITAAMP